MERIDWSVEKTVNDFKERAEDMGLFLDLEQQKENKDRYNIKISEGKCNAMTSYALIGLAHHFINRKWAKDISYMYIMKSHISLTFTNETD